MKRLIGTILCLILALQMAGCAAPDDSGEEQTKQRQRVAIETPADIEEAGIMEDVSVYDNDDEESIVYFYVTVRKGSEARETNHTFEEVQNAVRFAEGNHVDRDVFADALVQVGDEYGPVSSMLGYGETSSNATIRIRGNSSSTRAQKSYKLSLDEEAGLWRGQSNIALNKHANERSRLRNKLYFDLLKEVPEVPSLRTQWVRLFIKDETSGKEAFEDYGLYTQAEVPSKKYLSNHGLDASGYLYKAINFNFEQSAALKNFDDPDFNLDAMEGVVAAKGRQDNTKLNSMIAKVNDTELDINEVIDTYFDRENYEYWLAFNLLMGNYDTTMQNFYLYSPLNSEKWYFIPWDSDTCMRRGEIAFEGSGDEFPAWNWGITNYWGVVLHQRFLKDWENREELREKVEELYKLFTKESVEERIERYNTLITPYISAMPDVLHLDATLAERENLVSQMAGELEMNYNSFTQSLGALMPIFMDLGKTQEGNCLFRWTDAYDFDAQDITYRLTISRRPDMSDPVYTKEGLTGLSLEVARNELGSGTFYWRVDAMSADGRSAEAFDSVQVGESFYPGVLAFTI